MIDKLFSQICGFAAVIEGSSDVAAFDPTDESWVKATALKKAGDRPVIFLRVAHNVTAAWQAGQWNRPVSIDLPQGEIYFAGEEVAAMVMAGRREVLEDALRALPVPGRICV